MGELSLLIKLKFVGVGKRKYLNYCCPNAISQLILSFSTPVLGDLGGKS
jgi:hypothetical protein